MGEMDRAYKEVQRISLAVDCIIFGFNNDQLEVLLIHRGFEPEKERWSLMGGFVGNREDLDTAAYRILHELSGLEDVYMEQVRTFGKANRDPYERVVSTTYSALILKERYKAELIAQYRAKWFSIDELPNLIFDHKQMIISALNRLRRRVRTVPIVFNLLPEKFTLPQLQKLYEGILGEELDKRNFRKKLNTMDFLVKLDEKDMSGSRKGAYYYQFDEKKYNSNMNFNI